MVKLFVHILKIGPFVSKRRSQFLRKQSKLWRLKSVFSISQIKSKNIYFCVITVPTNLLYCFKITKKKNIVGSHQMMVRVQKFIILAFEWVARLR